MNINILLGEFLKKVNLNEKVYNNKSLCKILKSCVPKNAIQDLQESYAFLDGVSPKPKSTSYANNNVKDCNYDLTIIIPAYNVELYIDECLKSVLGQKTKYKFLVKIINDGSTDDTFKILKKYEIYNNVEIINQENKGFSGARNTGLKHIESKYLMFVDSDDRLADNAIQNLLESAYENDSDIVEGGFYKFNNNKILETHIHKCKTNINAFGTLKGYPWGKVIKSSLFKNIKFPEGFWYEDTIFMYLIFPMCKKATTIKDVVYWYRHNIQGISVTSKKKNKCIDTYWIMEQSLDDMELLGIDKTQPIYEFTLFQIYFNFRRTKYMTPEIQKNIFIVSCNLIKEKFNNYKTTNTKQYDLEDALRNFDYKKYYLYCSLIKL